MEGNNNTNNYLIPANSKKSQLILGLFTGVDLGIFLFGVLVTVILLASRKSDTIPQMILYLSPALVAAFLVAPVPNYHNVRTLIRNLYSFATGRKKYYWRGLCVNSGDNRKN